MRKLLFRAAASALPAALVLGGGVIQAHAKSDETVAAQAGRDFGEFEARLSAEKNGSAAPVLWLGGERILPQETLPKPQVKEVKPGCGHKGMHQRYSLIKNDPGAGGHFFNALLAPVGVLAWYVGRVIEEPRALAALIPPFGWLYLIMFNVVSFVSNLVLGFVDLFSGIF